MRIACPFCGERGNEEFAYLGDATVVRPDPGAAGATQAFADYVYLRDNPRGPPSRALVSRRRLSRLARRDPRHDDATRSSAWNSPAMWRARARSLPGDDDARGSALSATRIRIPASPSARRSDRPLDAAVVHLRRARLSGICRRYARLGAACQRRAASSAARSSITGRAAFSPPGRRSRTRSSSCATARAASRTRARRSSSCSTGSSRRARTAGRRSPST